MTLVSNVLGIASLAINHKFNSSRVVNRTSLYYPA